MEMRQDSVRDFLARAFYREDPKWLVWLFIIGCFTTFLMIGFVLLLIWGIVKLVYMFSGTYGVYDQYNACVQKDAEFLKDRAINVMGLIEEEFPTEDIEKAFTPFIQPGIIALDGCTVYSKKVNVVVLEI